MSTARHAEFAYITKRAQPKNLSDLISLSSNVRLKSEFPFDLIKIFREQGLFIAKKLSQASKNCSQRIH